MQVPGDLAVRLSLADGGGYLLFASREWLQSFECVLTANVGAAIVCDEGDEATSDGR
jgi:hypothetical protein